MRRKLIILANSRKMHNRCIAGIDAETGKWVRPVYENGDKGVPWSIRQVDGQEPALLDIVSIPLASKGPHRDIQPENRQILKGTWIKVGQATTPQVAAYCQCKGLILHNDDRRIPTWKLRAVPEKDRASLCLVRAQVHFFTEGTYRGKRVNAKFEHDGNQYCIPVTDYRFESHFPVYSQREAHCLLTISMGMPFERDQCCYKFIAGIVEL